MPGMMLIVDLLERGLPAWCGLRVGGGGGLVGDCWWVECWNLIIWYNCNMGIMSYICMFYAKYFLLLWDVGHKQ